MTTHIPNISRIDHKGTHGWLARYYAVERTITKLLSDSRYGYDPQRSLAAAQCWVTGQSHHVEPRPHFRRQPGGRNRTGHVGVCLTYAQGKTGIRYWLYSVSYTQAGKRRTKTFRLHHFSSPEVALQAAVAFRAATTRAMHYERWQQLQRQYTQTADARENA